MCAANLLCPVYVIYTNVYVIYTNVYATTHDSFAHNCASKSWPGGGEARGDSLGSAPGEPGSL